jgi:glycosyl transferase family 25
MKVLIINLERSKDRWARISGQLDTLNIEYERLPAIEGKKLTKEEMKQKTTLAVRTFLCNYGSVGCGLSHIVAWKKIAEGDDTFGCVAEDDASFTSDFPKLLKDIPKIHRETGFDLLDLYCDFLSNGKVVYTDDTYNIVRPKFGLSTCCYILTRDAAQKLLKISNGKLSLAIDSFIASENYKGDIKQLLIKEPVIVTPSLEASTLNSLNSGGLMNKIISLLDLEDKRKYFNLNILHFRLKYSISPYFGFLAILVIISLIKKWYILSIIIVLEMIMLICDYEL